MDFAFAIFPWFIIWDLNMKRKEKITVACGLSLGILYVLEYPDNDLTMAYN